MALDKFRTAIENAISVTVREIQLPGIDAADVQSVTVPSKQSQLAAWAKAWERGVEPIRAAALQSMKEDLRSMGATLAEDSYAFQAAMVLLASEFVGPYSDHIATLLGYSPGLVQVIAARLHEAQIWESDEVRCERWFDPEKGAISFLLDRMVAEGKFVRRWSEEENDFEYRIVEVQPCSRQTV
jgi:hypothetical protein